MIQDCKDVSYVINYRNRAFEKLIVEIMDISGFIRYFVSMYFGFLNQFPPSRLSKQQNMPSVKKPKFSCHIILVIAVKNSTTMQLEQSPHSNCTRNILKVHQWSRNMPDRLTEFCKNFEKIIFPVW